MSARVSVYCLCYNHEKYLRKCLDSLLMQKTSFDYEIIIHDDASTDSSPEIIREYQKKFPNIIKPILQKENQFSKGISIYKSFFLPNAIGDYYAECEGDDYWLDEYKLQKQFDALEANPNCSCSMHDTLKCYENGDLIGHHRPSAKNGLKETCILNNDEFAKLLFIKNTLTCPFQTSSFFYRKKCVTENFAEKWKSKWPSLDLEMHRSFLLTGDCYYIKEEMSMYRTNSASSISVNHSDKTISYKQRMAEDDLQFNIYSDYKYDKYIRNEIYKYISYYQQWDNGFNDRLMKEYKLSDVELFKSVGIKTGTRYLLVKYLPGLLSMYEKIVKGR